MDNPTSFESILKQLKEEIKREIILDFKIAIVHSMNVILIDLYNYYVMVLRKICLFIMCVIVPITTIHIIREINSSLLIDQKKTNI